VFGRTTDGYAHSMQHVRLDRDGTVATISLASPDTYNALDETMIRELREAVEAADADPDVRVVVVRGDGPAFCVGGSLDMFAEAGAESHALMHRLGDDVNVAARLLHETDKVTIAAVHGSVAGGAIGFMAACDLVLAAEGTTFCMGYAGIATTPDAGTSWFVTRDLGWRRAFELFVTNERFDAQRACELGLVTRVVGATELDAATTKLATRVAGGPLQAFSSGKRLFRQAVTASLDEQLHAEIATFADNTRHPDFQEGVGAFLERRRPQFAASR
jgi:2-(1,2-epoxy-1,2-dihydrophenyl)acetyl-CoA isomerase